MRLRSSNPWRGANAVWERRFCPRDGDVLCTIVRRASFDAMLARAACTLGSRLSKMKASSSDETARAFASHERGDFQSMILVGADGSGSRVRAQRVCERKTTTGRALMTDIA